MGYIIRLVIKLAGVLDEEERDLEWVVEELITRICRGFGIVVVVEVVWF